MRQLLSATVLLFAAACAPPAPAPPKEEPKAAAAPVAHDMPMKTGPVSPPTTEADMIASAMSAGPDAVAKDATIIAMGDKGQMKTLRTGTNQFTCMPDGPSPGLDPMCVDKNGLEWATALMGRKDPPPNKIGFGYMLMGGSDA